MIVVLNFGGQYCHLIARRVRDLGVKAIVMPAESSSEEVLKQNPQGIIFSGGPSSVYEENAPSPDPSILNSNIPILGICYGLQIMAKLTKGDVKQIKKEYGKQEITVHKEQFLLKNVQSPTSVWMSHGDSVNSLPEGSEILASTPTCKIAAFENKEKHLYGLQFHPEVTHTKEGTKILENFVLGICNAEKNWNVEDQKQDLINEIKETVGDHKVLMAVSGGVDSTVASVLIHEAIGDNIYCVFVDHGLIRKNEAQEVKKVYEKCNFKNFFMIDAQETFLSKLQNVTDPEEKRKIIGTTFIEVFEEKVKELNIDDLTFLGQGTIYPDRIESAQGSKHASKIKSHHNIALPEKMNLKVIEPLKEFYKDEVRKLGKILGIDQQILDRHPFPGPGLGIRILGEITQDRLDILKEADAIFIQELKENNLYDEVWQALAALIPVKTVGVMGDSRTYEYIITLRAVNSIDAMSADWSKLPPEVLEKISNRIINEVQGVNRVVYDISQKPPATIEYE